MDSEIILLDSSILIEYFRKADKTKTRVMSLVRRFRCCISVITVFEFKIGIKSDKHRDEYLLLTQPMEILGLDETCVDVAVRLYQKLKSQNRQIGLADLFIAATAVSNDLRLATLNEKDFKIISGLVMI